MNFNITVAQPKVWNLLSRIVNNDKVGNAYLFAGPAGAGKEAMAIEYGALINKQFFEGDEQTADSNYHLFKSLQHELLTLVFPLPTGASKKENGNPLDSLKANDLELLKEIIEKKAIDPFQKIILPNATRILINSIRVLRKSLYLKSDDIGRKIVIIFDAHLLSAGQMESANALLKILEEPPANTTIILVTDSKEQLLPTILSRCQQIDFPPLDKITVKNYLLNKNTEDDFAEIVSELSRGDMRKALAICQKTPEELMNALNALSEVVLDENSTEWRKFIEENSKLVRTDQSLFQFNLFLLQNWFKSVNHLKHGIENELHHPQLLDKMNQFNLEFPNANLKQINILIEDTIEAVGKNLYMSLTLTNLLINIHKNLK